MNIYYQNSRGKRVYLDREPYRMLAATSLFDYKWDYATRGNTNPHIVSFTKKMVEKDVSVVISGATKAEYYDNIMHFLDVVDTDVAYTTAGRLYVGNYYIECYFVSSEKGKKYINTKLSTEVFTIVAADGNWVKVEHNNFNVTNSETYDAGRGVCVFCFIKING